MTNQTVKIDGKPVAAGTAAAFEKLAAAFKKATGESLHVRSGVRDTAEQRRIFLARYRVQSSGSGPFGDVRWYQGKRYVRHSAAGTVAVPGTSRHETGRAVDIYDSGRDYGVTRANTTRSNWIRKNASKYGFTANGFSFGEPWHIELIGGDPWEEPAAAKPKPAPKPVPKPDKPLAFWLGLANVTGITYSDGVNLGGGWSKRGPKVAARVKALACSLYAVNEVTATSMTRTISGALASKFRHAGSRRGNDVWFDGQKFTLLQEREFQIPGIKQNRSVKWCELRRDGRTFNLLVPHFPNAAPDQRTVMARYIVGLTKNWRDPIILAGDFNNTSQGKDTPRAIFAAAGFVESRDQARTVVNGDVPEFKGGRDGAWLSDVFTKGCAVTDIRLVKVPATESTHHFFQARIEIGD